MPIARTLRLLATALVVAGIALSFVPVATASHLGDPGMAVSSAPADQVPVPDRPEGSTAAVGSPLEGRPFAQPAADSIEDRAPTEIGCARDGVHPRVERPPAA